MIFVYFLHTLQFGIKTKDGKFLSYINNKMSKNGTYFTTGSSIENALDFMDAGQSILQINDDKKDLDVTMNDSLIVRDHKTGNEEKVAMQIFNNNRFVIIFHGRCLTYIKKDNTFRFIECSRDENQKFESEILPRVNNSGVSDSRMEYGAAVNQFNKGVGMIANFLKGSLLKKNAHDFLDGKELSDLIKDEEHNGLLNESDKPKHDLKSSSLMSSDPQQDAIRNMLDPNREKIDLKKEDPFKPISFKTDDPMKKENELMAIKDLPKDLGLNTPPSDTTKKDILNPFKKTVTKNTSDNSKVPSVEDYFNPKVEIQRKSCSNVPSAEETSPLDEFSPEHRPIYNRRSPGGVPTSDGHKPPRGLRPSFNMNPNRPTQGCAPVY